MDMNALRVALVVFLVEIIGLSSFWLIKCLFTRKLYLVSKKAKGCLDIVKYLGEYWLDVISLISYGVILVGKVVIRFFWIVGIIISDDARKIANAAKSTLEIIKLIIKGLKKLISTKKQVLYQKSSDALDVEDLQHYSERGFIA